MDGSRMSWRNHRSQHIPLHHPCSWCNALYPSCAAGTFGHLRTALSKTGKDHRGGFSQPSTARDLSDQSNSPHSWSWSYVIPSCGRDTSSHLRTPCYWRGRTWVISTRSSFPWGSLRNPPVSTQIARMRCRRWSPCSVDPGCLHQRQRGNARTGWCERWTWKC